MKKLRNLLLLKSFAGTIPESDLVLLQRFRLFKITNLFVVIVFGIILFQAASAETGIWPLAIISALFICVFLNYLTFNVHKKPRLAFSILVLLIFAVLHVITYWSGGIRNSGIFYLGAIIFTAYMLLGRSGGKIMVVVSGIHIIYFYLISTYTDWTNYAFVGTSPHLIDLDFLFSAAVGTLMLGAQANYIEKSKNAVIADINSKKDELAIKNELLLDSQKILTQKNINIEEKNKELEQFAYVASHDLQEPLRTTSSFVELLQQQYSGKLDANANKYLSYIIQSSERMKILISDLLDYSRIGHKRELKEIDCNVIIKELLADLTKSIQDEYAEVKVDQLPVINGYRTEIIQLFQNLITNAIKFRNADRIPKIHITANKENAQWIFSISDNGIGIDKDHFERIFVIFQRLHTRTEYAGSGIGLAHCKKIVSQHGGRIWVDSKPGEGATFYFSIPENSHI